MVTARRRLKVWCPQRVVIGVRAGRFSPGVAMGDEAWEVHYDPCNPAVSRHIDRRLTFAELKALEDKRVGPMKQIQVVQLYRRPDLDLPMFVEPGAREGRLMRVKT